MGFILYLVCGVLLYAALKEDFSFPEGAESSRVASEQQGHGMTSRREGLPVVTSS